jgi:hypothetical protein
MEVVARGVRRFERGGLVIGQFDVPPRPYPSSRGPSVLR